MATTQTRASAELVEHAHDLVAAGVPRQEAATKLAALAPDRQSLQGAHVSWVRRMHRLPTDDYDATNVLRLLEAALSQLPRTSAIGASAQT
jgi:hypothetical protein